MTTTARPAPETAHPISGFAIVHPFPDPPPVIAEILTVLGVLAGGNRAAIADLGDTTDLPRPWNPWTCRPVIRLHLWAWLDHVAGWINQQYVWRPTTAIPACWPHHPHIAVELPAVVCLRYIAGLDPTPDRVQDWHDRTLPAFIDRTADRIGEAGCRTGRHTDWPAAARYDHHTSPETVTDRHTLFRADTTPRSTAGDRGPGLHVVTRPDPGAADWS